jgi:hypothetical protein
MHHSCREMNGGIQFEINDNLGTHYQIHKFISNYKFNLSNKYSVLENRQIRWWSID